MTKFNILYFAFVSDHFGGVEQKIIGQFDALKKINEFSNLYLVSTNQPNETLTREIDKRSDVKLLINQEKRNPLKRRAEKFDMIKKSIQKYDAQNSIIYFRYPGADFLFYKFLKDNSTFKIVTEHQEIENKLRIGKFTGNYLSDISDFIFGRNIRKLIHGFVGVSNQYLENQISYLPNFEKNKKPTLVNGNGIEVSKYKLRQPPIFDGKLLKILFVGGLYKSHGMHRLIEGLIKYDKYLNGNQLSVEVHIAGITKAESYLVKYESSKFKSHTVFYHGFLSRIELDILMDKCNVAVNSLSLHRIGLSKTSTLKSREYFARGIPFITASEDNDFSSDNFFIHRIISDESPVIIPDLFEFMDRIMNREDYGKEMRDYADDVLDWRHKMEKLNAFLATFIK
jgi:glycosyltransferase involved in cell wall biosynthesis